MSVTRANMAIRALRRAGKLSYNESAEGQLNADALQAYDEVYDELSELGIVDWGSTASVPNEYVFHVTSMVAYRLADMLGVSDARYMRLANDNAKAEPAIRRMFNSYYTPTQIKVVDY